MVAEVRGGALPIAVTLALLACVASCSDSSSSTDEDDATAPLDVPVTPAAGTARRLTIAQYHNLVRDTFGDEVVLPSKLEPDAQGAGLIAIGAGTTSISSRGVEQYEEAARQIGVQVTEPGPLRERLVDCGPGTECTETVVARVGRRLWRRPLRDEELARVVAIASAGEEATGDFHGGLGYAIAALLQSPKFLFRIEVGEPDPEHPGEHRFTSSEMASRLAFLFWNTGPDEALLDLAQADALVSDEGLGAAVDGLLESDRLDEGVRTFFADMLGLAALDELTKDPTVFVRFSNEVGPSAREETLRAVTHHLLEEDGDYRDLMTTRTTFLDRRLAAIYGVPAPERDGFGMHQWDADATRHGLLGHVSILAGNSHATASSATLRGRFVRESLLCAEIPSPPVDVNTALPEVSGTARTLRERVAEHLENPSCAGCHAALDPVGLGLENFDGLGSYREEDNGAVIDATGELDGTDFADAKELGQVLRDHADLPGCLVTTLYRYATGRVEESGEHELIEALTERFALQGHRLVPLMKDIATSDGFRCAKAPVREGGEP